MFTLIDNSTRVGYVFNPRPIAVTSGYRTLTRLRSCVTSVGTHRLRIRGGVAAQSKSGADITSGWVGHVTRCKGACLVEYSQEHCLKVDESTVRALSLFKLICGTEKSPIK